MIAGLLVRVGRIIIVTLVVTFLTALLMDQLPGRLENILVPLATDQSMQPIEKQMITQLEDENRDPERASETLEEKKARCIKGTEVAVEKAKPVVNIDTTDAATGKVTSTPTPVTLVPKKGVISNAAEIDVTSFCSIVVAKVGVRDDLNLNDAVPVRWGKWLGAAAQGDFGNWYLGVSNKSPVFDDVKDRIDTSLLLLLYTQIVAFAIAIPLAVYAAYRKGSIADRLIASASVAALAVPSFAVGLILAYVLGVQLRILPPSGYAEPFEDPVRHFKTMIIPSVSLGIGIAAVYLRALRTDMSATLQQDFVAMARAKGLSPRRILMRHAFRPSSLTLITLAGLNIGTLIGGAVIVEVLFGVPGLGTLVSKAIFGRQVAALQTLVALLAIIFVVVNQTVDMLYSVIDPRIRSGK